ncbi:MAG: UDP-N-acetylmuramoyl-L-alanyl-D-glutamate--2,6-diaminopimelate ligase [Burkholderiales bacterium]|nr:UDP-N-acetylmuramoyl-L-alanyl-D-glutamate--2,6-diaminopimelate ligase [Burkholderiales bacterium]
MAADLQAVRRLGVRRLTVDSRAVRAGDTFVAYPGESRDGRDYIAQAIANGAASVLWDTGGYAWNAKWRVPNLGIPHLRREAGVIAAEICGRPSARLWTVGITGTNGKTSCSQWVAQSLTRMRRKCAVIGTLGSGFPGKLDAHAHTNTNTTPDAVTLQARMRGFARTGARAVCMEVSSHGLEQDRLSGVEFDVAMLTNLSRDHLDYHGTMRRYKAAKAKLFRWPTLGRAVLNLDDAFGRELAQRWKHRRAELIGYGFGRAAARSRKACVEGRNLRLGLDGVAFEIASPWGRARLRSPLIGGFNAANLLGSLAVLLASGMDLERSVAALEKAGPVPGRTERYGGGRAPLVVVDYAHTPDALEKVLRALRGIAGAQARLFCVFGCGGGRDRGKRPLMGAVASSHADRVIVTSDNPRDEDPAAIIGEITEGVRGAHRIIVDRREAIRAALAEARRGDVVLVAGKGHENYQEIRGLRRRFSDAAVVRSALAGRTR